MDVVCIKCGRTACIKLDLADGDTMTCSECDEEFTTDDVREVIATWDKLLKWLETHPARVAEREEAAAA